MFLLSIVVFYFARLAPGDPLESFYGDRVETMTPVELEAARARLGLDGPIWMQYIHWLSGVFQGDFGISLKYKIKINISHSIMSYICTEVLVWHHSLQRSLLQSVMSDLTQKLLTPTDK